MLDSSLLSSVCQGHANPFLIAIEGGVDKGKLSASEEFGDEGGDMFNMNYRIMDRWQVLFAQLARLSGLENRLLSVRCTTVFNPP